MPENATLTLTPRHPGLCALLRKLERKETLTGEEVNRLQRQVQELREHAEDQQAEISHAPEPAASAPIESLVAGHANREGGERFATRCGQQTVSFYRRAQDLLISNIGIGTYRGGMDQETDAVYISALFTALNGGINLIDTSLNYRHQRSERNVGVALRNFFENANGHRDELVVCSKGGYLVPEAITAGTFFLEDVVGNVHCIAPDFLSDQIERSRRNLGLERIDVYYLHNPETQLEYVSKNEFLNRIRVAFERLELAVADNRIRFYGTSTWHGYYDGGLSLSALLEIAREVGGNEHHFRFIQLPFHLGVLESTPETLKNLSGVLQLASISGITVIASASLMQGRLSRDLPDEIKDIMPGLDTDAQRAVQFTRSTPGISCALVGMRRSSHVLENIKTAMVPPLTANNYERLQSLL